MSRKAPTDAQDAPRAIGGVGVDRADGCFVGIDPGFEGAVAFLHPLGLESVELAPTMRTRGEPSAFDRRAMVRLLSSATIAFAAIEHVDAAPMKVNPRTGQKYRQGTTSMFRFGQGAGMWLGILEALGIPYVEVRPQTWKKAILRGMPAAGDGPKAAAIEYVRRFHPAMALIPPGRRVEHSGVADAICIAEYARRAYIERQLLASAAPGPRPARPRATQAEERS